MERRIYKYDINDEPWTGPPIMKILGMAFQHGKLRAWCEVDIDAPEVQHRWVLLPTGGRVMGTHAGSTGRLDGTYVWHIYYMEEDGIPAAGMLGTDIILNDINASEYILF